MIPVTNPAKLAIQPLHHLLVAGSLLYSGASLAGPDFTSALDAAWQHSPLASATIEHQQFLQQRRPYWQADRSAVSLDYSQGKPASAIAEEWQASLTLSVANPVSWNQRQQLADLEASRVGQSVAAERWRWSGLLQNWWWNYQALTTANERTGQQLQALQQQLQWQDLLIQQGERPAADRLPLLQSWQQLKAVSLQLNADLLQEQTLFRQWTRLADLPDNWHFERSQEQPLEQHPLLVLGQNNSTDARLQRDLLRHQSLSPEFSIGWRHVAAVDQLPAADLLQAGIRIPFGSASYREQRDAIQQQSSTDIELLNNRQQLARERLVLEQQLPLLQQQLDEAEQLSQQANKQYQQQYQAWRNGSLPGFQWLQLQNSVWQLQQQADTARIQFYQSISTWNQLQGIIPE